jgi:hypothetical protein
MCIVEPAQGFTVENPVIVVITPANPSVGK